MAEPTHNAAQSESLDKSPQESARPEDARFREGARPFDGTIDGTNRTEIDDDLLDVQPFDPTRNVEAVEAELGNDEAVEAELGNDEAVEAELDNEVNAELDNDEAVEAELDDEEAIDAEPGDTEPVNNQQIEATPSSAADEAPSIYAPPADQPPVDQPPASQPPIDQPAAPPQREWPWDDDPLDPLPPNWPHAAEMPTADFPAIPEPADPEEETRTVVLVPGRGWAAQPKPAQPASQPSTEPPAASRPITETSSVASGLTPAAPSASPPGPPGPPASDPASSTSDMSGAAAASAPTGSVSRPAKRRAGRNLFWPAFVASLLLCSTVACGGLALLIGLGDVTLADLQGNPVWTPPPSTATPPPALAEAATPDLSGSVADTFQPGDAPRNVTNSRVNIRREPGFRNQPASDIVAQAAPDDPFVILGPSARADNLIWWQVRHPASNTEGWVAEATESGVQILGE